jgi:hypothetical protein
VAGLRWVRVSFAEEQAESGGTMGGGWAPTGGGVSERSGTLDFGACVRAVRIGGRGSIRWRRCGRARSSRLILSPADSRCSGCRGSHSEYLSRTQSSRIRGADGTTPMDFVVLPPEAPAATDAIYQLLAVLADRAKAKAALAKVVAARNEAQAAAEKLGDLQIERAALQKQQAEFEAWTAEKIREAHRRIDASRAEFNVERAVHATKVEALRADREQLERSRSAHESKLAELHRGARPSAAGREGELPISQIRLLRRGGQDAGRLCRPWTTRQPVTRFMTNSG